MAFPLETVLFTDDYADFILQIENHKIETDKI